MPCSLIRPRLRRTYSAFARAEALDLVRLLAVGADHANARERLLHHRAEVRELRLDRFEAAVDGGAEILHADGHERQRNERDQRQAPVDRQHQHDRDDKHEHGVAEYITAGPIIMRTAFRSLVARDIRSPVRCA